MVFASKLFSSVARVVFQASKDLESYVQFDGANLYSILHPKKSHKAPTEFCFCIVVSDWLTKTNPSRPEKTSRKRLTLLVPRVLGRNDSLKTERAGSLVRIQDSSRWSWRVEWGPVGLLNKVLYGEAPPRGPIPYPFICHYDRKRAPFVYILLTYGTPFTYSLKCCIPFKCC